MSLMLVPGLALALASGGATRVEPRTVTKSSVYLVKSPSFLSPRASRPILRGQRVQVELPDRSGWLVARHEKDRGYIHLTYVSDRPGAFVLADTGAKGESMIAGNYSLAVGGFSEGAEQAWRAKHPDAEQGFRWLDAHMPAHPEAAASADPAPLAAFVQQGKLRAPDAPLAAQEVAP